MDVEALKRTTVHESGEALQKRFDSFSLPVFKAMHWANPANWQTNSSNELQQMEVLAKHFAMTLAVHRFDGTKLKTEWRSVKHFVKSYYASVTSAVELWERLLQYRRKEFPNVCLLAEVIIAVGVSNGTVESTFSYLTAMLTDRRLSLSHDTMSDLLLIRANDAVWTEAEKSAIIESALTEYLQKRRRLTLHSVSASAALEPAAKRFHAASSSSSAESDSESDGASEVDSDVLTRFQIAEDSEDSSDQELEDSDVIVVHHLGSTTDTPSSSDCD